MEKKVMNTRLAVAAVVLLFGLLLAGQEAAAAAVEEAATATSTDVAEATLATTPSEGKASYGKSSKADCEVPGTCDVKLGAAAADPKRPGAEANPYSRGCSKIDQCRD